jgi:hypothetical protein
LLRRATRQSWRERIDRDAAVFLLPLWEKVARSAG